MHRLTPWLGLFLTFAAGCDLDWSRKTKVDEAEPDGSTPIDTEPCEGREGEEVDCSELSKTVSCGRATCRDALWDTSTCSEASARFEDRDEDGVGGTLLSPSCSPAEGSVAEGGDCNDDSKLQSPRVVETCDTLDNDCNGKIDDGPDADGDGIFVCDNCPDVANPTQTDLDSDGLGWACDELVKLPEAWSAKFDEDPPGAAQDDILRAVNLSVGEDLLAMTWGIIEWAEDGVARVGTQVIDGRDRITEVSSQDDWTPIGSLATGTTFVTSDRLVLVSDGSDTHLVKDGKLSLAFAGSANFLPWLASEGHDLFTLPRAPAGESLHRWYNGQKVDLLSSDAMLNLTSAGSYFHIINSLGDARSLYAYTTLGLSDPPLIADAEAITFVTATQASAPSSDLYYCATHPGGANATFHWISDRNEFTPVELNAQSCGDLVRVADYGSDSSWASYPVEGGHQYLENYFPRSLAGGLPLPEAIWAVYTVDGTTYVRSKNALYRKVGTGLELLHAPLNFLANAKSIDDGLTFWNIDYAEKKVRVLIAKPSGVTEQSFPLNTTFSDGSPSFGNPQISVSSKGDWFGVVEMRSRSTNQTIMELWQAGPSVAEPVRLLVGEPGQPIVSSQLAGRTLFSLAGAFHSVDLTSDPVTFGTVPGSPNAIDTHQYLSQASGGLLLRFTNPNGTYGVALWNGTNLTVVESLSELSAVDNATPARGAFWVQYRNGTRAQLARVDDAGNASPITWPGAEQASAWTYLSLRDNGLFMAYRDSGDTQHLLDVEDAQARIVVSGIDSIQQSNSALLASGPNTVAYCFADARGCAVMSGQTQLGEGAEYAGRYYYWPIGKRGGDKFLWKLNIAP